MMRPARRAFTLIEFIVALAILAILAAIAIPVYSTVQTQATQKADMAQANTLAQAVSAYYAVNGCYPDPASTSPSMPVGLSPFVGGPWPANYYYETTAANGSWVTTAGGTVYYVLVSYGGTAANAVYVVNGVAVLLC